jgi:hypothetical protein
MATDATAPTGSPQLEQNPIRSIAWLAIKLVLVLWLLLEPIEVVVIEYQQF